MRWGQDRSFGLGLFLAVKVSAAIDCTHALGGVFGDLLCQRLRVTEAQKHIHTEAFGRTSCSYQIDDELI